MKRILTILWLFLLALPACGDEEITTPPQTTARSESPTPVDSVYMACVYDSIGIILPQSTEGRFDYAYRASNDTITITSSLRGSKASITYILKLKDNKGVFSKETFFYGDIDYDIADVYFVVDGKRVNIEGTHASKVSEIWAGGNDFISFKSYIFDLFDVYLINGWNLYCNGTHCTNASLYSISVGPSGAHAKSWSYNEIYPFIFNFIQVVSVDSPYILVPYDTTHFVDHVGQLQKCFLY